MARKESVTRSSRRRNYVTVGHVRIPWYRARDGRTFVDPRRYERPLFARKDHESALTEARKLAIELNGGGVEAAAMSAEDRAAYALAKGKAETLGLSLTHAIALLEQIHKLAEGLDLPAAVAAGVRAIRRPVHHVADVAAELIASKADADLDGRYKRQIGRHLMDFAAAFPGEMSAIEVGQIETWIKARTRKNGQPLSAARRDHVRDDIIHLFKFARTRGYLPDEISAAQRVPKFGVRAERKARGVEVFTPAEMRLLLAHIEYDWLPYALVAGFSGARPEEICRSYHAAKRKDTLRWEDFDWDEREIIIRPEVDKNGFARRCPIIDNLWTMLAPWRDAKPSGRIVTGSLEKCRQRLKKRLRKVFAESADDEAARRLIAWPHDVLRHSYGTYRMAVTGRNVHQVAAEMGNSPSIVRKHYDKVGPRSHGKAWFSILLGDESPNVIQLGLFKSSSATGAA
jgi:integrase